MARLYSSDTLVFKVDRQPASGNGESTECLLMLINSSDRRIGFKMRSSAADYYGADPATGIVEPGRRLAVSVRLWNQHGVDLTTLKWERHRVAVTYHPISDDFFESDVDELLMMHKSTAKTHFLKCVIRYKNENDQSSLKQFASSVEPTHDILYLPTVVMTVGKKLKVMDESFVFELERKKRQMLDKEKHFIKENEELRLKINELIQANKEEYTDIREQMDEANKELSSDLSETKAKLNKLEEEKKSVDARWEVSSKAIKIKKEIGRGAYATVYEGLFKEQKVAVKVLHDIKSEHNFEVFRREVSLLAQLRHPNLLLFIAVAFDHTNERPLMVMELMTMSLREGYTAGVVERPNMRLIMYDVACALYYLHSQEEPILHRDVSSANVLLQKQDEVWRGKLSDFGAANLARLCVSSAPGAEVYTAPEVPRESVAISLEEMQKQRQQQTTKIDVFSYGVLLCEVFTENPRLPSAQEFPEMLKYSESRFPRMHQIIKSCIEIDPASRPTIKDILVELGSTLNDSEELVHLQERVQLQKEIKEKNILIATLKGHNTIFLRKLQEEQRLVSILTKQKEKEVKTDVSEKDEEIKSLELGEEEKERHELEERIESLQRQLQQFIIPQSDLIDSSITIAGHGLFHLKADDRPSSFKWDKYGFRLRCPEGAVSKDTEVAVTPLLSDQFEVPKGTVLVSAVYKIEVSKPLTKRVVIELQHCVDLRNTGQTSCLKFVRASLKPPYQFDIIDGGVFRIGNRYGSIERDDFSHYAIVAEMSNGGSSDGGGNGEGGNGGGGDNLNGSSDAPTEESNNEEENTNGDTNEDTNEDTNGGNVAEETEISVVSPSDPPVDTAPQGSVHTADTIQKIIPQDTRSIQHSEQTCNEEQVNASSEQPIANPEVIPLSLSDVLYTGMMYHEKKEIGHWKTMYSVVRDLDVLKQHLESKHEGVEYDDVVDSFNFIQHNGCLQLLLQTPREPGWTVNPDREPLKLLQSRVDKFPSTPSYSSCSMSVYAKPGIAQDPLHCPIKLTGIDPETTIYINRSPPSPLSINIDTTSTSSTNGASETSRETKESTFRSDVAYRVMLDSTSLIKDSQISLTTLANKLLEKKVINAELKTKVMDEKCGLTVDERKEKLLKVLAESVRVLGKLFEYMIKILKEEDTVLADNAAEMLLEKYTDYTK